MVNSECWCLPSVGHADAHLRVSRIPATFCTMGSYLVPMMEFHKYQEVHMSGPGCCAKLLPQVTTPTQQQAAAITKGNGGRGGGGSGSAAPEENNAVAEVGCTRPQITCGYAAT